VLDWVGEWAEAHHSWLLVLVFLALAGWESLRPARQHHGSHAAHWFTNFSLYGVGVALLITLSPAVLADAIVSELDLFPRPFALLGQAAGDWAVLAAGVLILDLYAYAIHRVEHQVFAIWRFHSVHHSDTEMDASTTVRHHPIEVLFSTCVGAPIFSCLSVPSWVFPIYAFFALTVSLVQHANAGRVGRLDRACRWLLVTPGLHQIHHSVDPRDHNANYGTVLSLWDRMFGTYRGEPEAGCESLAFGVTPFTSAEYSGARWAWLLPFRMERETRRLAGGSVEARLGQPGHDALDRGGHEIIPQMRLGAARVAVQPPQ
jgi:sterol desaturase/sphingolipid hydroxylase (fatty acid hydroxylase superfamily)